MLRIRDVYPGSWIRIFSISDSGSRIRIKEFKYFKPKKLFLNSLKYDLVCSSRIRIPDPAVKKAPDPGSGSATLLVLDLGLFVFRFLFKLGTFRSNPIGLRSSVSRYKRKCCTSISPLSRHFYPEKEGTYTFWTYMMNCRAKVGFLELYLFIDFFYIVTSEKTTVLYVPFVLCSRRFGLLMTKKCRICCSTPLLI